MIKLSSMRTFIHVVLLVQRLSPSFVNFFQVPRGVIFFLQKLQVTRHVLLQIFYKYCRPKSPMDGTHDYHQNYLRMWLKEQQHL